MVMSNFIDELERHTELYGKYTSRQIHVLRKLENITRKSDRDEEISYSLLKEGITDSEINWLKRAGHFLPAFQIKDDKQYKEKL